MTDVSQRIDELYREHSRQVLATLIRLLGDFDVAEEAVHDAFTAALEQWPTAGVPANPVAWLISAGRFKAIDRRRRDRSFSDKHDVIVRELSLDQPAMIDFQEDSFGDDRLRLIFTCCHPALSADAQVALTLRTVGGLTTEEIAHAFLLPAPTLAQRIVRAKNKIRQAGIPYEIPASMELPDRLSAVLAVLYLIFNEGYSASAGSSVTRIDLSAEAIRLARLLATLIPDSEAEGLLAMMLLHDSRRAARTDSNGDLVLLEDQDRSKWNAIQIDEGRALVEHALRSQRVGRYTLQAAIACVHADAITPAETNWREIAGLYDVLLRLHPTAVVELNRAVAIAMSTSVEAGLVLIDDLCTRGELAAYHHVHAARADMLRRLGREAEALAAYDAALALTEQEPERRFLARRIAELKKPV